MSVFNIATNHIFPAADWEHDDSIFRNIAFHGKIVDTIAVEQTIFVGQFHYFGGLSARHVDFPNADSFAVQCSGHVEYNYVSGIVYLNIVAKESGRFLFFHWCLLECRVAGSVYDSIDFGISVGDFKLFCVELNIAFLFSGFQIVDFDTRKSSSVRKQHFVSFNCHTTGIAGST